MNRRVRRKAARFVEKERLLPPKGKEICTEVSHLDHNEEVDVDWIGLPDDTVVYLFTLLNYRDRVSLASTCRTWQQLGTSPCLWRSLDLRAHRCSSGAAMSLAPRCQNLYSLRFRGSEVASSIIHLQARNLREISGDCCNHISDATLSVIAARHEVLESLSIGSEFSDRLSCEAVKAVAVCCPKLKKLRLFGLHAVDGETINQLGKHCKNLAEIAFVDFYHVDGMALGNIETLKFLSVAGTKGIKWTAVANTWNKLCNLRGLDVSRTDICHSIATKLLSLENLKVFSALSCPGIEEETNRITHNHKLLLTTYHDILKGVASLFGCTTIKGQNNFADWRKLKNLDINLLGIMDWLEWVLPHSLVRVAEIHSPGLDSFWLGQGAALLLSLMQSPLDDVRERAATGIASFVVIDDENATVDGSRAEIVLREGGVKVLLELSKSSNECMQSEAAKAIANLSVNAKVAKAVADEGGITTLADLARSKNRSVAEEAAGGLWNLSVGEEHKFQGAIAQAGGVKALVELISKWRSDGDIVLERAAGALANLAADEKCSMEVASAGGVEALVMLARNCKFEGVQEQSARALANLAAHGDSNSNNSTVGSEEGALLALVQLTYSRHDGVRQEAAGALWNLSFDDRNREAIAAAGGVEALVSLAQSCSNSFQGLQERAAGALWGLSVSESNSVAIGREGGIRPLVALAQSEFEDVHETAAGALWNLAFNPGNAVCIVEEGGVPVLVHLCSSSGSKMARFMAALALAYMFDGRMEDATLLNSASIDSLKSLNLDGPRKLALKHIEDFVLTFTDSRIFTLAASSSSSTTLVQVAESARIPEAGHLRCSGAEIGRFLGMVRNPSSILRACAAFALLQFTLQGGRHAMHHICLLQNLGAARILRAAAAAATAPLEAKIFAKLVLRNLELHQQEHGAQL